MDVDLNDKISFSLPSARSFHAVGVVGGRGAVRGTGVHTAATAMIEAGAAPTAVQAILGHKDFTTMAKIYTSHNDPQDLLQEMQKITLRFVRRFVG